MTELVVSAPGSLMLMGEHAVLHGSPSVVCAVDQRLQVSVTPRTDRRVLIRSTLGDLDTSLDFLAESHTHRFTLALLTRWRNRLTTGFEMTITSDFSDKVGLGSSAALTVVVATVLRRLSGLPLRQRALLDECISVVKQVQGHASGSDIAASIHGGVVCYRPATGGVLPLGSALSLGVYYCGYKMPTADVIKRVEEQRACLSLLYDRLFEMMSACTQQAISAIQSTDLPQLGHCMNIYHGLLDSLGVCDSTLASMVFWLREQDVLGAKISGSGLGDCVVCLLKPDQAPPAMPDFTRLPVSICERGVCFESDTHGGGLAPAGPPLPEPC